jgi:hypothetical protein
MRLRVSSAPVAMANPTTVTTPGRIRRCHRHGRAVTCSVAGIASWQVSLVKTANSAPRLG